MDIRPSPRILQVLGDIEFEAWQCIAELVDNAFDDFLELQRAGIRWPDGYKVSISLPDRVGADCVIRIEDTGRGMDLATLNNAVRAGWSSNDRFSKLGLFGMGFNVATARLGRVARVFTARPQDAEWIGVEIDLDKIGADFQVPVLTKPKSRPSEHGTVVEVTRLEPNRTGWLIRHPPQLRKTLGDVYSYLLDKQPFELYVSEVRVQPRRPCVWEKSRSVTYGSGSNAEQIPAIIEIDHQLPAADACVRCGTFQAPGMGECAECGAKTLEPRERRIHGWLGIQRHLHKNDFGIDFLRNGRKILRFDKRIFSWTDPNEPLASPQLEYPVELGQGGRIVGEIHLDYVPVNYQKNAFEWGDKQWIAAMRFLRGDGPLLPQLAKKLGYPPNDSPLARLHRGYRRNDPGYRYLIPGNGMGPIHSDTLEWSAKFQKGTPEYQSDLKWWEAVVFHETKAAGITSGSDGDGGDILTGLGLGPTDTSAPPPSSPPGSAPAGTPSPPPRGPSPVRPETEKEKADRLRASAHPMPALTKEFALGDLGSIEVTAFEVRGETLTDANGARTPVWLWREVGKKHFAFVDLEHPVFKSFAVDPAVLLSVEVAHALRTRSESRVAHAELVARVLDQSFDDLRIEQTALSAQARELMDFIRLRMAQAIASNPERAWQHLSPEERGATETNLVVSGGSISLEEAQRSGEFLQHVPATFIARLVDEWPDAFLDGKVFRGAYATLASAPGRQIALGRIVSYLYDVAVLASSSKLPLIALSRAALSVQLLRTELARGGEA